MGNEVIDMGTGSSCSVDYPDYAEAVADAVSKGKVERGILICGTGIGMSIVANKFKNVRAALCNDLFTAKMSRLHNDANILCLGGKNYWKGLGKRNCAYLVFYTLWGRKAWKKAWKDKSYRKEGY